MKGAVAQAPQGWLNFSFVQISFFDRADLDAHEAFADPKMPR